MSKIDSTFCKKLFDSFFCTIEKCTVDLDFIVHIRFTLYRTIQGISTLKFVFPEKFSSLGISKWHRTGWYISGIIIVCAILMALPWQKVFFTRCCSFSKQETRTLVPVSGSTFNLKQKTRSKKLCFLKHKMHTV